MFKTIPLIGEHLEDAALLVSKRYQRLLQQVPELPHCYADVTRLIPPSEKYPEHIRCWGGINPRNSVGWFSHGLANAILPGSKKHIQS